ncbi:MAG: exo-alpha-sialidase [Opitutaceae bacterium]|nr:exo-alpha-sialidase [Opitutaceae bacterium]
MSARPFAYSDIFRHPAMSGQDLPSELASVRKNESSVVILLKDGTWFVTWSQGSSEGAHDEQVVFATSNDCGLTWTEPRSVISSTVEWRRSYGCPFVVPGGDRIYFFCMKASTMVLTWRIIVRKLMSGNWDSFIVMIEATLGRISAPSLCPIEISACFPIGSMLT